MFDYQNKRQLTTYEKVDGDSVAVGDVIGLIEVMKSFHEVKSDIAGTVKAFLVENEGEVMAGQPLVDIET